MPAIRYFFDHTTGCNEIALEPVSIHDWRADTDYRSGGAGGWRVTGRGETVIYPGYDAALDEYERRVRMAIAAQGVKT